jgi:hypothetical protein
MEAEKYVRVVITVTDDEGVGYEFTAFRAEMPHIIPTEETLYLRSGMDDFIIGNFPVLVDFDISFRARPDFKRDDRNIYQVKVLPRPEGEE